MMSHPILRLLRCHKPTGFILLAAPMILGFLLAQPFSLMHSGILIALAFLSRCLGCAANDFCDYDIDLFVTRTHQRPLAQGEISLRHVAIIGLAVCLMILCLILAFFPLWVVLYGFSCLAWIGLYSTAKRWCPYPQLILGFAFSWSLVLIALYAQPQYITSLSFLFLANTIWVISFDTVYAQSDWNQDRDLKIYSIPKSLGPLLANYLSLSLAWLAHFIICALFPSVLGILLSTLCLGLISYQQYFHLFENPLIKGQEIFFQHNFLALCWIIQACLATGRLF